jgi:hypothetical protein
MPSGDRGSLKAAFAGFKKPADEDAERKLLGRAVAEPIDEQPVLATAVGSTPLQPDPPTPVTQVPVSYQVATSQTSGLTPRPLMQREAVRQLSFRCPVSITAELRRKAAFNQLEQQQIIVEGLKRVLAELPAPPAGWDESAL